MPKRPVRPIPPALAREAADRFWSYVDVTPGHGHDVCWLWTGGEDRYGYGIFSLGGESRTASRVSWALNMGVDPGPLWVLHHCDTPACVKPSHLYLGDRRDNTKDMYDRNRRSSKEIAEQFRGEKHYRTRLTEEVVKEMRDKYAAGGVSYTDLAAEYGLSKSGVVQIIKRRTWKHAA